ncbi:MAG: hypothetical protein SPH82_05140 [Eubacteriales bacterium]|nr:hypothetical protein [Eubacteriales bacterium]
MIKAGSTFLKESAACFFCLTNGSADIVKNMTTDDRDYIRDMPDENTLRITGEASKLFGKITYTSAGNYYYALTETDGGETGYADDDWS